MATIWRHVHGTARLIIALTQYDLKRILAYSTVSQLGYMFLGLGAASQLGICAGMFHLFTHAFITPCSSKARAA